MTPTDLVLEFDASDVPPVDFTQIADRLGAIAARVSAGDLGQREFWRGADVIVTPTQIPDEPNSFYPGDDQLITDNVAEISWAFYELRDAFESFLSSESKYWFFGTLRAAAELSIAIQGPTGIEDPQRTVALMVQTANEMLKTIRQTEGGA